MKYVCSTSFITDKGENVVDIVFLCKYESGDAFAKSKDEVEAIFWLSTDDVLSYPNCPDFLKSYVQQAHSLKTKFF